MTVPTLMTNYQIVHRILLGPPIPGIYIRRNGEGYEVSISFSPGWVEKSQLIRALLDEGFYCFRNHTCTYKCNCWRESDRLGIKSIHTPWSATINLHQ